MPITTDLSLRLLVFTLVQGQLLGRRTIIQAWRTHVRERLSLRCLLGSACSSSWLFAHLFLVNSRFLRDTWRKYIFLA